MKIPFTVESFTSQHDGYEGFKTCIIAFTTRLDDLISNNNVAKELLRLLVTFNHDSPQLFDTKLWISVLNVLDSCMNIIIIEFGRDLQYAVIDDKASISDMDEVINESIKIKINEALQLIRAILRWTSNFIKIAYSKEVYHSIEVCYPTILPLQYIEHLPLKYHI